MVSWTGPQTQRTGYYLKLTVWIRMIFELHEEAVVGVLGMLLCYKLLLFPSIRKLVIATTIRVTWFREAVELKM
jgi:hypothetical protein